MGYLERFYNEWHSQAGRNRTAEIRDRDIIALKYIAGCKSLIELGCGSGEILSMADTEYKTGVDISENAIQIAKTNDNLRDSVLKVINIDAEELPFENGSFDGAMAIEVLEHLFDPVHALSELNRVLSVKGKLIVTVPNIGYFVYRLYHLKSGEVSDFHGNGLIVNEHIRYYSVGSLVKLLKVTGFDIVKVSGCMKTKIDCNVDKKGKHRQKNRSLRISNIFNFSPLSIISKVNKIFSLWNKFPGLFAIGIVIEATKKENSQFSYNTAIDHQQRTKNDYTLNVTSI